MHNEVLWIWLSETLPKGGRTVKTAVNSLRSIKALYEADRERLVKIPGLSEKNIKALEKKNLEKAEKILADCEKNKIRVITPESKEYPGRLKQIVNPPAVLYAKGLPLVADDEISIAIVGTRNASRNGEVSTDRIAYDLAAHGVVIVSGLAKGIDAIASSAALRAGGKTVAVLGSGVDVIYPRENRRLAERIEEQGTIVSEYPPGTQPFKSYFPQRNRIISGLSLGVLIPEAPEKSGSLITAKCALEQDRDVFAVPSGIFEKSAEGTNNLIKQGAIPVTSAGDVLAEYAQVYGDKIKFAPQEKTEKEVPAVKTESKEKAISAQRTENVLDSFSGDERKIMEALFEGASSVDEIVKKSGLDVPKILASITLLEIRGSIKRLPGNKFKIKD